MTMRLTIFDATGQNIGDKECFYGTEAYFKWYAAFEAAEILERLPAAVRVIVKLDALEASYTRQSEGMAELMHRHAIGRRLTQLFSARQAFWVSSEEAPLGATIQAANAYEEQLLALIKEASPDTVVKGIIIGLDNLDV